MRQVIRIDVGSHEDKAGFTLHFADGEKEHFLFAIDIAEDLANKMLQTVKDLRYVKEVLRNPGDNVGIGENVSMRLVNPEEVREDGTET